ncbi:16039_t:CDS:1, partial [Acaulospora morrowiae]
PPTTEKDTIVIEDDKKDNEDNVSSNEKDIPTVEQFRLYEELEELEKQLELEISEDLADI